MCYFFESGPLIVYSLLLDLVPILFSGVEPVNQFW